MLRPSTVPSRIAVAIFHGAGWLLLLVVAGALIGVAADARAAVPEATDYDDAAFHDPPAWFWPGYFWILNDRLDLDTLFGQLEDMRKHDARSVCIIAEPREFRPDTMGNRLDPPYLSKDYFKTIRAVVDRCGELGMNYWLYDEGGWPSGGAAGRVYRENPAEFGQKSLGVRKESLPAGQRVTIGVDDVIAATWDNGQWRTYRPGETVVADKPTVLYHYVVNRRGVPISEEIKWQHVDLLHPDVTPTFLRLTHEGYRKAMSEAFGKTVHFTFTDEPRLSRTLLPKSMTWTDDLAEQFRRRKGYDLLPWLPAIMNDQPDRQPPPDSEQARQRTRALVDFRDVVSQLYGERFTAPIRAWCHANGLQSGGHFDGDDSLEAIASHGAGHLLRQQRGLDMPGTDVIWRQVYPGGENRPFVKYASSVARQKGQPLVMCEMFCVYGNGITPAEIRWVTDFQYVRGTTLAVLGCYPYSPQDHFMPGLRPHFGPVNPYWKYLSLYHAYAARLGYLLSRGHAAPEVAVYFDIRGLWAEGEELRRAVQQHEAVADALLKSQRDFDFIDDDILAGREGNVESGEIVVGPMRYQTLIVPATRWMETASLENLAKFVRQGGTVLAVDTLPSADGGTRDLADVLGINNSGDEQPVLKKGATGCLSASVEHTARPKVRVDKPPVAPCDPADVLGIEDPSKATPLAVGKGTLRIVAAEDVGRWCRPMVRVSPESELLRVNHRVLGDRSIYFLANEGDEPLAVEVGFDETAPAVVFDVERGVRYPLATQRTGKGSTAQLKLPGRGSRVVGFGFAPDAPVPAVAAEQRLSLNPGWKLRPLRQYRVGEHRYEIEDVAATPEPARLGDWRKQLGDAFSGDAEYSVRFDWNVEPWGERAMLDLGEVQYACEVFLNGKSMGRRIWAPFRVELTSLRPGENELRVVVTNTLANAILDPEVRRRWASQSGPGWTINYDKMAAEFEKDSLPSGLIGPVRVFEVER